MDSLIVRIYYGRPRTLLHARDGLDCGLEVSNPTPPTEKRIKLWACVLVKSV